MKESISFCRKVFLNNFSFPIYIKDESPVVSSSDFLWQWFLRQDVSRLRITALKLIKLNVEIVNSLKIIQSITEGILNSFYIEFKDRQNQFVPFDVRSRYPCWGKRAGGHKRTCGTYCISLWALGLGDAPVCEMFLSCTLTCTFLYIYYNLLKSF